jgi:hypothetical protein
MPFRRRAQEARAMKKRAVLLMVFVFCFVCAALFSESPAGPGREHDCRGEGCPICLLIQKAENFSRHCKAPHAGFPVKFLPPASFVVISACFYHAAINAVRLKIRMNT